MDYEKQAEDFLKDTKTELSSKFLEFGSMDWDDKGVNRNIFLITLKNAKGELSIKFGDSIQNSCEQVVGINPDKVYHLEAAYKSSYHTLHFSIEVLGEDLINYNLHKHKQEAQTIMRRVLDAGHNSIVKKAKYSHVRHAVISAYQSSIRWINNYSDDDFEKVCYATIEKANKDVYFKSQSKEYKHPTAYDILCCLTKGDPGTFEDFCNDYGYDEDSRSAERIYNAVVEEWKKVQTLWTEEEIEKLWEIQ